MLLTAVWKGHLGLAKWLASTQGCALDVCETSGLQAVHYAAWYGDMDMLAWLKDMGIAMSVSHHTKAKIIAIAVLMRSYRSRAKYIYVACIVCRRMGCVQ